MSLAPNHERTHQPRHAALKDSPEVIDLIVRVQNNNDRDAFAELHRIYHDRLLGAVHGMTRGTPIDPEAIEQEAFMQAWQKIGQFHFASQFYTWLHCIAHRLFLSASRLRRTLLLDDVDPKIFDNLTSGPSEADLRVTQDEVRAEVRMVFAALKEEHREVLTLQELQSLTYKEIATRLGIAVNTVRSRLHRARNEFRETHRRQFPDSHEEAETKLGVGGEVCTETPLRRSRKKKAQ